MERWAPKKTSTSALKTFHWNAAIVLARTHTSPLRRRHCVAPLKMPSREDAIKSKSQNSKKTECKKTQMSHCQHAKRSKCIHAKMSKDQINYLTKCRNVKVPNVKLSKGQQSGNMSECQNAKLPKCKRFRDPRFFFPLMAFIIDNIINKNVYFMGVKAPP